MALEKIRGRVPMPGELAVVVGAGRSGIAAAKLLRRSGARVRLLDKNPQALNNARILELGEAGVDLHLGPHKAGHFEGASFIVPSPGMPIHNLGDYLDLDSPHINVLSELELAWRYLNDEPVLAVTGTSGKTTTASLAAAMLKAQGYMVFLGGNIGTPLSEYVLDSRKADVLVLECSSFQLQGCSTFCPRAAVLLNISPNHLDYHKDMEEYIDAKFRIFRCQDEGDIAILDKNLKNAAQRHHVRSRKIWMEDEDLFPSMRLLGRHNAINAEAAWQAARFFGASLEKARKAVEAFAPLPHRLESVAEIDGVQYVNDSKCTTPAALKVALEAFDRPVRLLCGGKFKGGDLAGLRPLIEKKTVEIALFGASREHFEKAWEGAAPISWSPSLAEAVEKLRARAAAGDVILLAPATSSFDLYKNYMERGEDFKKIVSGTACQNK